MGYLLVAGFIGLPLTILDRTIFACITRVWFAVHACDTRADCWYHATDHPLDSLDLSTGVGQLGSGLYLHPGFVSPADRFALELESDQSLDSVDVVSPWSWRYTVSVGHYFLAKTVLEWFGPTIVHKAHALIDRVVFSTDRVQAPEFAYPWRQRQLRLGDSARNRRWLRTTQVWAVAWDAKGCVVVRTRLQPQLPPIPDPSSPASRDG